MCKRCNGRGPGVIWRDRPDLQLAASKLGADKIRKHGLGLHPLYPTWQQMMYRTSNPKHPRFKDYGGRGIVVCEQWRDVTTFIGWILANLGPRPDGCTLDRIDNDRGYEPGNMRWATPAVQNRNQRKGTRPHGSAKALAKLTEEIVRQCRARRAAGEMPRTMAAEYGVSVPTMYKAITGRTWQHVT